MEAKALLALLYQPRIVLIAILFSKHAKRRLCNSFARWMFPNDIELPPGATIRSIARRGAHGVPTDANFGGPATLYEMIGATCSRAFKDAARPLGAVIRAGSSMVPMIRTALGTTIDHLLTAALSVAGETMVAAHQHTLDNVFGNLLEVKTYAAVRAARVRLDLLQAKHGRGR